MQRILLVDDEEFILTALQRALRPHFGRRIEIDTCSSGEEALKRGAEKPYHVVVSDLRMPDMDGVSFLTFFAVLQPNCVRLMLTGSADFATAQSAVNEAGVFRYLTKPWNLVELVAHMRDALDHALVMQRQHENEFAQKNDRGQITPQEVERRALESAEPGLTHVQRDAQGLVIMPALD